MKNNNEAAKQEDKKALPKFIAIVVCSLIVGGVLGVLMVQLSLEDFQEVLDGAGLYFTNYAAPWLIIALPAVEFAICLPLYFSAKQRLAAWDGEDETVSGHCGCGNKGCLEQVASATGLVKLAKEELERSADDSLLRQEPVTAKAVFDAVKAGDQLAIRVAERFGDYLGKAIATFTAVLDPEVIVIGGGVSKAGPILLEYIQKHYLRHCYKATRGVQFVLATLGNDAGMYGCVRLLF